jgi:CRISPR type III-A/MTUBE-associated protein Csm6
MNEYILFSPLGMSDPTRGCHDGAFIHICRFYKPKKVYLYMSAEVCHFDELDNRYERYLNRLCEKLDFECEVEKMRYQELIDVHDFDAFYKTFLTFIEDIAAEYQGSQILINLSSGTPQMKSALYTVCSMSSHRLIPIQVSTPVGKSNRDISEGEQYDVDLSWEYNLDNDDSSLINRCIVVKNENYNALIKREIIMKHIATYDYNAALAVAETIPEHLDQRALNLIKAGKHRLLLETIRAEMFARNAKYELISVIDRKNWSGETLAAFEYILILQIKGKRDELADFIRGISPVLTTMYEIYLKEKCKIDIKKYCIESGQKNNRVLKLSRRLLPPDLLSALDAKFSPRFKDSEPCASNLSCLISVKGKKKAALLANRLRHIEEKARNIAAHEIVSVTDQWIKDKTNYNSEEILQMLKDFFSYCVAVPQDAWNSYDQLNEQIMSIPLID